MGRKVDLADIIDAGTVAEMLGLTQRSSVRLYRHRYEDFPAPILQHSGGRCLLWLRQDVAAWVARHPRGRS